MKLNARITFAAGAALAVIVGALLLGTGIGHASEPGPARRGQPCAVEGSYARDRSGDLYVCEQRPGDRCPVYHAAEPRPGKWGKPSPCVCPKSPSGSPSAPSSPSKPATASPKPVATLPVTGDRTAALLILSGAAISAGALLLTVSRRRRAN